PARSLLWINIEKGEALFNGEAIRTSERGTVRIVFSGTERFLDIEPESLIFLRKNEGEISLDLMEGSLFVKNDLNEKSEKGAGLVLNSANGKIDLSKASASLSKSGSAGLNVEVLEGKASIQSKDGKVKEISSGSKESIDTQALFNVANIKIESPLPRKPVYMNPKTLEPVLFKWSGFPVDSQISLWIGNTKKSMKEILIEDTKNENLQALKIGTYYWKLVANSKNTGNDKKLLGETSVYKLEVTARYPPLVKSPSPNQNVIAPQLPQELAFEWEKPADMQNVTIELSKDPDFKKILVTKKMTDQTRITYSIPTDGNYYYRLIGIYKDSPKTYSSDVIPFRINTDEVLQIPVVWTMNPNDLVQYFLDTPSLNLRWTSRDKDKVTKWRLSYHLEKEQATDEPKILEVQNLQTPLTKPGRYIASVEALDQKGRTMGVSEPLQVDVQPLPLIGAPKLETIEGKIKASQKGETEIKWSAVKGAQEYQLTIKSGATELKKSKYKTTSISLKNLMPGEYQVEVIAIDEHGRNGQANDVKTLVVPDKSGIRAPKLKGIKVN
ncbi:MAG TPA: hypothetical protein PLU50_01075, partial [Pseudobdellovibrionaceae bacterium]|nr:hypothetical protein [Pseudobdellovibrionaceae bacterium]